MITGGINEIAWEAAILRLWEGGEKQGEGEGGEAGLTEVMYRPEEEEEDSE